MKKIVKILVIMAIGAILIGLLAACGGVKNTDLDYRTNYYGSGEVKTKAEALGNAEYKLVINNVYTENGVVNIKQGEESNASITTNTNILDTVSINVTDGVVTVEGNKKYNYKTNDLVINIGGKVKDIEINGAFKLNVDQDKITDFNIEINGACYGDIRLGSLNNFDFVANGAGKLDIWGSCVNGSIELNGANKINAFGLIGQNMDVVINGAGEIDVHATAKLEATVNGVGKITYEGNPPAIQKSVNGLGKIGAKNG